MLKNLTNSHNALVLSFTLLLISSTCLLAADPYLTPEQIRGRRVEKVRRRAETHRVFKRAQDFYYDGLWLQARVLFVQVQRDGVSLGIFRDQTVKGYLRAINLKVDRLCRPPG